MRKHKPIVRDVIPSMPEFLTGKDYIVARFHIGGSTFGVRFVSPEQLMTFCVLLMEKAVKVWPDHNLMKEYLEED